MTPPDADAPAVRRPARSWRGEPVDPGPVSVPHASAHRRDIDALRGIAVAAVVLYHAFPSVLAGGFVGVDVFFVISGYLITGIVARELDVDAFSLLKFYSRRINRIFPALVAVLLSCIALGAGLLLSAEFAALGAQTVAAVTFTSNFALLGEAGYFDAASHTKPLLHLWSLAIEEQFYIAWPLALLLAHRLRLPLLSLARVLAICSFVACAWCTPLDQAAAFYLPVTRGWELLVGGVLALAEREKRHTSLMAWPGLGWIGIGAIVVALFLLDPGATFPGVRALLPVVGAAAFIGAGRGSTANAGLGSIRWIHWLGTISYPLYLWHWPLLSFARIVTGRALGTGESLVLVAASVMLAWSTFRLLESPLRRRGPSPTKSLALVAGLLVAGLLGDGASASGGVPTRGWIVPFDAKARELRGGRASAPKYLPCDDRLTAAPPFLRYCKRSRAAEPDLAVFGDSHADHLFDGLARNDPGRTWLLIGHNATPPLAGVESLAPGIDAGSESRTAKALDYLTATASIKTVVVAFFADAYLLGEPFDPYGRTAGPAVPPPEMTSTLWPGARPPEVMRRGLELTIRTLQASGKRVVLVLDLPELPFLPKDCIPRPLSRFFARQCVLPRSMVDARQAASRAMLRDVAADLPGTLLFDLTAQLCDPSACRFETGDTLLYHDSSHLTATGSDLMARALLQFLAAHPVQAGSGGDRAR